MQIDILTLFPDMLKGALQSSILKRAKDQGIFNYNLIDFRTFSANKHHKVDDYPYGGGAGMVLTPQPIFDAVASVKANSLSKAPRIILLCPQGEPYNQEKAEELSREEHLIMICGHYEGYDERIREALVTDEISIGDYVLTSGEIGALAVTDSVIRLLPDALGNDASSKEDSFSTGLLEHPHYTRPADYKGMKVPEVLLSGNHELIASWRRKESLRRTAIRRPELLEDADLTEEELNFIKDIQK